MREIESVICPYCGEYIGELDELDSCPVCGHELSEENEEE